jgi:microcystin-dependent protein
MDTSGNLSAAAITFAQLAAAVQQALNPSGSIIAYGGASAPAGYLICDGSAVSRTTYSALFSAIGTANGIGDGSTTFNVPDCRGMFLRGVTGASANDPDASSRTAVNGGNSANNVGSVQGFQIQSHIHNQGAGSGGSLGIPQANNGITPFTNTTATGGDETRPINIYVTYCIKT